MELGMRSLIMDDGIDELLSILFALATHTHTLKHATITKIL